MGLFGKKKQTGVSIGAPDISNVRDGLTLLGKNLSVKGTVLGDDDIQLLGVHVGDFDLKGDLNIHQSAKIVGNVKASTISVGGTIEGNVSATKKMKILQTANISGDIKTPVISIQEGAQFNGRVNMGAF
jgi:cytoskeletal protein CcmA (bactofilin family)